MRAPWLLLTALVAVACSTGSRRVDRTELSAAPSTAPANPPALGRSAQESTSGGLRRRWLAYLPQAASEGRPLPLLFNLHGSGGTPEDQLALTGLEPVAEREGFVLVAPEGVERMWNVPVDPAKPDDVRFFAELIEQVSALTPIDRQRVYATGFSGGGRMVSQLACDLSGSVAAIAAIGGIRFPGPCAQARPMPILAFHGTADDVNPYDGGGRPYWQTGVEPAIAGWAEHNRCAARTELELAPNVRQISYGGEGCGAEVVLYRIDGFGHTWPAQLAAADGASDTHANQLLWRFLAAHPLPVASK
jgi:polyhydroxybutyrate depolymerase